MQIGIRVPQIPFCMILSNSTSKYNPDSLNTNYPTTAEDSLKN